MGILSNLHFYYNYSRRRSVLTNLPVKIWIEPTNYCNIRCKTCPQLLDNFPERGMMSMALFERLAIQAKRINPALITLHLSGEPLIHKQINEFIKILKHNGQTVTFSTNGVLLNRPKIEALIEAGIDDIRIDFCANKSHYENIRQKSDWDLVNANIVMLVRIKEQNQILKPHISLVNIDVGHDPEENMRKLSQLKSLYPQDSVRASNFEIHTWAGQFARETIKNEPFFKQLTASNDNMTQYSPCIHLFGSMNITWDGFVVPCCRDLLREHIIGDANSQSLYDIWNSEALQYLRQKHISGEYRDIPLCRDCDQVYRSYSLWKLSKKTMGRLLLGR